MEHRKEEPDNAMSREISRRTFVRQSLWAGISMGIMPWLINACKKTSFESDKRLNERIIIVGAGISGLYAASLLAARGADVLLLEASEQVGGRIKTLHDFASFPINLGADTIRGEKSVLYDLVRSQGANFVNQPLENLYYFNGSIKNQIQAEENTFFNTINDLRNSLGNYSGGDISAEAYGNLSGVNDNVKHIWNAWIGNARGTSNSRLGMHGLRAEVQNWSAGNQTFRISTGDLHYIITQSFQQILPKVQYNTVISGVNYSASKVVLTDQEQQNYEADRVIMTVPIGVLKAGAIEFTPPLPVQKTQAITNMGVDSGLTILFRFSQAFWPSAARSIIGPGNVPIFHVLSAGISSTDFVLSANTHGSGADYLISLGSESNIIAAVLGELDFMFGNASDYFIQAHVQDWGADPFIQGSVSYARIGTGNARAVLAQSIANRLYFAGEATHTKGHNATMHGAMESALNTVLEILSDV